MYNKHYLILFLQKAYDKKSSVLSVKLSYMDCMSHIFKNEFSKYAVDIIPLLLKCVEKCSQSSQVCIIIIIIYIIIILKRK